MAQGAVSVACTVLGRWVCVSNGCGTMGAFCIFRYTDQTQLILLVCIPASQSYTVRCTEWNGASSVSVTCSVFDIWEGLEWVSDHVHMCNTCTST